LVGLGFRASHFKPNAGAINDASAWCKKARETGELEALDKNVVTGTYVL
jgi:hypothetical protein